MSSANYKPVDDVDELKRIYKEISKTKPFAHFQFSQPPDFHPCQIKVWVQESGSFYVSHKNVDSLIPHLEQSAFFNSFLLTSQVLFKSKLVSVDSKLGVLQFSFPEKFFKIQRRKHIRVPLSDAVKAEANVTLINPTDMKSVTITRQILDLSMGGVAIKIEKDDAVIVKKYSRVHKVEIKLGELVMTNPGEIKNVTATKIGIEMDLKNQIQQKKFAAFLLQQLRILLDDPTVNEI